jgi:hypothetical protein
MEKVKIIINFNINLKVNNKINKIKINKIKRIIVIINERI